MCVCMLCQVSVHSEPKHFLIINSHTFLTVPQCSHSWPFVSGKKHLLLLYFNIITGWTVFLLPLNRLGSLPGKTHKPLGLHWYGHFRVTGRQTLPSWHSVFYALFAKMKFSVSFQKQRMTKLRSLVWHIYSRMFPHLEPSGYFHICFS